MDNEILIMNDANVEFENEDSDSSLVTSCESMPKEEQADIVSMKSVIEGKGPLNSPINTVTNDRIYECPNCEFITKRKNSLKRHSLVHQTKEEAFIYECKDCMFKSKYKYNLDSHIQTFHVQFECDKDVTENEDGTVNCNMCSFVSKNMRLYIKHMVGHTVRKGPVRQCPQCPMKFMKTSLANHIVACHGRVCPKCGYKTENSTNFRRHCRTNKNVKKCRRLHKDGNSKKQAI